MPDSLLPFAARQTSDGVFALTAPITVGNTAVESVVMAYPIPANSLIAGTTFDILCSGFGGTTAQNLTLRLRYGGLAGTIIWSMIILCAATTAPKGFLINGLFTCRTPGSTGTAYGQGMCFNEFNTVLPNPLKHSNNNAAAPAVNTTTQNDLALTAQWATAAAGATITATNGYFLLTKA